MAWALTTCSFGPDLFIPIADRSTSELKRAGRQGACSTGSPTSVHLILFRLGILVRTKALDQQERSQQGIAAAFARRLRSGVSRRAAPPIRVRVARRSTLFHHHP